MHGQQPGNKHRPPMIHIRFVILLLIFRAGFAAQAQCPSSPVLLTTQAQVNAFPTNFPGCDYLGVRFEVAGADVTDLTPLSQLTGSSKNFYVNFNPALTSLTGLDNITEILGDLTIEANHSLTSLQGMGGLTHVDKLLKIQNNDGLLTLDGMTAGGVLTNVASLVIIENDNLTDLSDLLVNLQTVTEYILFNKNNALLSINTMNNLTSVGWYLSVEDNASLVSLNAFNSLNSVGLGGANWNFEVNKHPNLTTINDFVSLSELGHNFSISNNTGLTSIDFPSLNNIPGTMSIAANTSLTSLVGLGNFTLVGGLTITGNTSLPECEAEGICAYLNIVPPKPATISNNATGCSNRQQVETACAAILPVELTAFNGKEDNDAVLLHWHTASEKNNDHFRVEHSTNGIDFVPVGTVPGKGTTAAPNDYVFRHDQPANGRNYYRLQQVDFDGTYAYSSIISVELTRGPELELYPNPTTGYVKIKGDLSEGTACLSDLTGRLITTRRLPDEYLIDLTREPAGVYLLEIRMGEERVMKRVVKE